MVNGVINISLSVDSSATIETDVDGYQGKILLNGGEESLYRIRQGG